MRPVASGRTNREQVLGGIVRFPESLFARDYDLALGVYRNENRLR